MNANIFCIGWMNPFSLYSEWTVDCNAQGDVETGCAAWTFSLLK